MNLKKIQHEDKKRILNLYLNTIGNCNNCGKCQYCVYKYIIYNLRNKKFTITTKTGIVRDMPSFENMESFGYTLLQTPLESLIISYPIDGLKEHLSEIREEAYSNELSPSFSESLSQKEENNIDENDEIDKIDKIKEIEENDETDENDENNENQKSSRPILKQIYQHFKGFFFLGLM
jgi:hypothetical protein